MKVLMVCTGNICRSPMMERIAAAKFAEAGLDIEVTSGGVSDEEHGRPMNPPARKVLEAAGYDSSGHRAHQVTAREVADADLVIAAEDHHRRSLLRLAPTANVRLLSDFNPDLPEGTGLPDPWCLPESVFVETRELIEAAMPGLVAELS